MRSELEVCRTVILGLYNLKLEDGCSLTRNENRLWRVPHSVQQHIAAKVEADDHTGYVL